MLRLDSKSKSTCSIKESRTPEVFGLLLFIGTGSHFHNNLEYRDN